jgi:hypothetical protein
MCQGKQTLERRIELSWSKNFEPLTIGRNRRVQDQRPLNLCGDSSVYRTVCVMDKMGVPITTKKTATIKKRLKLNFFTDLRVSKDVAYAQCWASALSNDGTLVKKS